MNKKSLLEENPSYMAEWDYEKNKDLNLDPAKLSHGSTKKAYWKCAKCGHEWMTCIYNRSSGTGCPKCGKQKSVMARSMPQKGKSFGEIFPELVKEWSNKNSEDTNPYKVKAHSRKKVLWKCSKCGMEWQATFDKRANGNGCPVCAGRTVVKGINDLQTLRPDIALEWCFEQNGGLKPTEVTVQSARKVYWRCKECGHIWKTAVYNRTTGYGCPKCGLLRMVYAHEKPKINESLAEQNPRLAKEWNFERNGTLTPNDIKAHSSRKVWWKCSNGHEWLASVNSRNRKQSGCPACSLETQTSYPEQAIFYYLLKHFKSGVFNRYNFEGDKEKFEVDVYISSVNVGIEYDGMYWHKNKEQLEHRKEMFLQKKGIRLIRVKESNKNFVDHDVIQYMITPGFKYQYLAYAIYQIYKLLGVKKYKKVDLDKDAIKIMENYKKLFYENSFACKFPEIAKEWDYDKNGQLRPEEFKPHSNVIVYWKCTNGHSWKADINHRTSGKGCPYCAGKKVLKGYNDLASQYPELLREWDYENNLPIKPDEIAAHSSKVVNWKCSKCGGKWKSPVLRRTSGYHSGCPYCANRKVLKGYNDLASKFPELLKEWDFEKNNCSHVYPDCVLSHTHKIVHWKCAKCGYEWMAPIDRRTGHYKSGCPQCAGKVKK